MHRTPDEFRQRPFTRAEARSAGITDRMLGGARYRAIHAGVYVHTDCPDDFYTRVAAARLALPATAAVTGATRLRTLGLDLGLDDPLHFVLEGDLHLTPRGVFVHRTVEMPPTRDGGVEPCAAFVAFCRTARFLDAVKVGDWLLHAGLTSIDELIEFAEAQIWRDGAPEALMVAGELDGAARSLPESELRVILIAAGLPAPEVNVVVDPAADELTIADLFYEWLRLAIEYEGTQHQLDRDQYGVDIDRYAAMRASGVAYVQVTKEKLRRPQRVVGEVYRAMIARGYDGPPPLFADEWRRAFTRLSVLTGPNRNRRAA